MENLMEMYEWGTLCSTTIEPHEIESLLSEKCSTILVVTDNYTDGGVMNCCLTEGEARAWIASRCAYRLYDGMSLQAAKQCFTIDAIPLAEVLENDRLKAGLISRLNSISPYQDNDPHEDAECHWVFHPRLGAVDLLIKDGVLVPPTGWSCGEDQIGSLKLAAGKYLTVINHQGMYGVVDHRLRMLIPCRYPYLSGFVPLCDDHEWLAEVITDEGELGCDIINIKQQRINPPGVKVDARGGYPSGYFAVYKEECEAARLYGLMDCRGELLGDIRWMAVSGFEGDVAAVQDSETQRWGFIDKAGDVCIAAKFPDVLSYDGHYAVVKGEEGREGVIRLKALVSIDYVISEPGEWVITNEWLKVARIRGEYYAVMNDDKQVGLASVNGRILVAPMPEDDEDDDPISDLETYLEFRGKELLQSYQNKIASILTVRGRENDLPLGFVARELSVISDERTLRELGLWMLPVVVRGCSQLNNGLILKEGTGGYIGWQYPLSHADFNLCEYAPFYLPDSGQVHRILWGFLESAGT